MSLTELLARLRAAAAAPVKSPQAAMAKLNMIGGELDDLIRFSGIDLMAERVAAAAMLAEFQETAFEGLVAEAGGQ